MRRLTVQQILKNGISLNYAELNEGALSTLIFLHGNSHSHKSFKKQASSPLLKDFRLIFLDLPGHGDSGTLDEYSVLAIAEMVSEFIKIKKLENFALVGHSLGGHIAIHSLQFTNPMGLFISGTPPLQKPFDPSAFMPNANAAALFQASSTSADIENLMNELNYTGEEKIQAVKDYLKTDSVFRGTIFNSIPTGNYLDEVELLKNYKGELHILIPTRDTLINNKYITDALAGKKSGIEFSFIEAGHNPHEELSETFNSTLYGFSQLTFNSQRTTAEREPVITA